MILEKMSSFGPIEVCKVYDYPSIQAITTVDLHIANSGMIRERFSVEHGMIAGWESNMLVYEDCFTLLNNLHTPLKFYEARLF